MKLVSVWFSTKDSNQGIYPMVMVENGDAKRYHYRVTGASLNRFRDAVANKGRMIIMNDGWTVYLNEEISNDL